MPAPTLRPAPGDIVKPRGSVPLGFMAQIAISMFTRALAANPRLTSRRESYPRRGSRRPPQTGRGENGAWLTLLARANERQEEE